MIESLVASNKKASQTPLPGSQTLLAGDTNLGWYGEVPAADLIDGAALSTLVGLTLGTPQNQSSPWLKFAYQGKTLFVAKQPFRTAIGMDKLKIANIVNGSRIITVLGNQYKIRLITGTDGAGETTAGGEWNDLIYRVAAGTQIAAGDKWANYTAAELIFGSGAGALTWCKENRASATAIYITRGNGSVTAIYGYTEATATSPVGWRPVLEPV